MASTPLARYYGTVLKTGSKGTAVRSMQTALNMPVRYRTGNYLTLTKKAVLAFQRRNRLRTDGVFTRDDWAKLDQVRFGAVASRSGRPSMPTLRVGSRGAAVRLAQTELRMATKYRTGNFQSLTKAAVVRFQKTAKLRATGVVDATTWKRLGL